jgi:hypothetical protein
MTLKRDPKDIHRIMGMMAELELKSPNSTANAVMSGSRKDFWASLEKMRFRMPNPCGRWPISFKPARNGSRRTVHSICSQPSLSPEFRTTFRN